MKPVHILLVEDNAGDIVLTKEAFEESLILNKVTVITDGESAINYLENLLDNSDYPDIILLDINLPKKNGHEVLKFIKTNDDYKSIPVIMLTTSSSERDVAEAYKNHANSFITKPLNINDFMEAISKIENFWFKIAKLPKI